MKPTTDEAEFEKVKLLACDIVSAVKKLTDSVPRHVRIQALAFASGASLASTGENDEIVGAIQLFMYGFGHAVENVTAGRGEPLKLAVLSGKIGDEEELCDCPRCVAARGVTH